MSRAAREHAQQSARKKNSSIASSLRLGAAHDNFEQEADRAAEKVLSGEHQRVGWSLSRVGLGPVQRQCACGGTCDACNKKGVVQRRATSSAAGGGHAPASVSGVLSRPGSALDDGTRGFMESGFGYDFSQVRIHHDDQAAASARDVSAHAYTVGSSIVFNRGKYEPHSPEGQRLLAHELSHVVQQGASGRRVQRDFDDTPEGRKNAADIDETFAGLYSALYGNVESNSPEILIAYADNLSAKYEEAQRRKDSQLSQLQLASILSRIYSTLKTDESSAERDNDGALLTRDVADLVPWTKARPRSVSDIPTFTPERILAWQGDAAANDREQALRKGKPVKQAQGKGKPANKEEAHPPPPLFDKLVTTGASAAVPPPQTLTTNPGQKQDQATARSPVEVQPRTADEQDSASDPGAGPVVQAGLSKLDGAKLSSLDKNTANPQQANAGAKGDDKSLLDACAQIWFLSNRMYLLDRSGHLVPREDAWFDISGIAGLRPGGVYFLKPGNERVAGTTINFRYFTVSGTGTETPGVSLKFPHVLTALIPVLDLNSELARAHAGVGLIIAPTFAQKRLSVSDISPMKLLTSLKKVPGHMPWAVNAEVNRIIENPTGEVVNQAMAFGLEWVSKFIPIVGQAAMLYQLIELSAWLGEVANIAAYAQTEDEIDIAAQAIARKVAQFVVFEALHRGIKGELHPEPLPGAKREGGGPEPKTPVKESPEVPTGKTEGAPTGKTEGAPTGKTEGAPTGKSESAPTGKAEGAPTGKTEGATAAQNMDPVGKTSPVAIPKEGKLASEGFDTPGSGEHHEVIGTKDGFGRCSEGPCPAIPVVYANELAKVPEFKSRYDAIRELGETNVAEATKEAAALAQDIEAYKLAAEVKPVEKPTGAGVAADQKAAVKDGQQKIGESAKDTAPTTPGTSAAAKPAEHAIDDVLSPDHADIAAKDPTVRSRFTPDQLGALDRLQAAYESYKKQTGAKAQTPEGWLRSVTTGKPREDAEALFGGSYARGGNTPGVPVPPVALEDIVRPADYSESRLQADLATAKKSPALWERLTAVRQKGILDGKVPNAILNILKGNLGEIFARPAVEGRLAALQKGPGGAGARTEFHTYIEQRRPDGSFEAPKLFTDGLIVAEKGNELQIHDVFEVKSGEHGGAEATSQFFEWREGRLNSGDRLVLSDGRKFVYAPGKTGPAGAGVAGYARGMMTAKAHIVATRGAEHLGGGSGEQIGAQGTRTALPQTASEIEYLAKLLFESLPQVTSPPITASPITNQR